MTFELVPLDTNAMSIPAHFKIQADKVRLSIKDLDPFGAFEVLDNELTTSVAYAQGSLMYTIYILALQKAQWDELDTTDRESIALNFYQYASRKFGVSQNSSTVDNYIRVAKTWLLDGFASEKQMLFEIEDGTATTVLDDQGDPIVVEPSIWDVPFSKLLVATIKYNRGEMEEDDWGLLFNPKVSQSQLITYWNGPKPTNEPPDVLAYAIYNGHLCAVKGREISDMAEVDTFSINNDALAEEGWKRLMSVLKVEMMDDSLVTVGTDGNKGNEKLTSCDNESSEEDF